MVVLDRILDKDLLLKLAKLGDEWAHLVHIARIRGVAYGIGRLNSRQSPPPPAGVPPQKAGGRANLSGPAEIGEGLHAEALEGPPGLDTPTKLTAQGNSKKKRAATGSGGPAADSNAKPRADNGLEVLIHAREVQIESLAATSYSAGRDPNVTINNYYLSPHTEASLGIPSDGSPPQHGRTTSIINELIGGFDELDAADLVSASDTDNDPSAIGKQLQDLRGRVEWLESAVSQCTHPEHCVANRDSTAGGHDMVVSTSRAIQVSGTGGTITPAPGMAVPATVFGATPGTPIPFAPPCSLPPHTNARHARRANTDGGAPISQRPSPLED